MKSYMTAVKQMQRGDRLIECPECGGFTVALPSELEIPCDDCSHMIFIDVDNVATTK